MITTIVTIVLVIALWEIVFPLAMIGLGLYIGFYVLLFIFGIGATILGAIFH